MNCINEPLSCEGIAFEDVESARVQGEAAGVGDPESAQRPGRFLIVTIVAVIFACTPEAHFLDIDMRLQDGHQCGLVLADSDLLLDGVFKHLAYFLALGLGALLAHRAGQGGRFGLDSSRLRSNLHRLGSRADLEGGVNLVGTPNTQIKIGQGILLETGSVDKERRIASRYIVEVICATGVAHSRLGGPSLFIPNRDPGTGDITTGLISDRALKTASAASERGRWRRTGGVYCGLVSLRRKHNGLGQRHYRAAGVIGLRDVP